MGRPLYAGSAEVRDLFALASDVLGWDLWDLCARGADAELNDTSRAQPAIFTLSYAMFRLLGDRGWRPDIVAGHSLGEFTAAAAAGVFSFQDGLRTVAERGRLMAQAAQRNPGTMLALLGAREDELREALAELKRSGVIEPANHNCPGQVVLSLERGLLDEAKVRLGPIAKKVVELPVSGAFHSALMDEARVAFSRFLAEIPVERPRIPLLLSVLGVASSDPEEIRNALADQMTSPVRWQAMVEHMAAQGVTTFVEIGPKDVLSGLIRRIAREVRVVPTDGRDLPAIVSQLGRPNGV
jgi:[acyl-carrier-protein] S-malonyltransferase